MLKQNRMLFVILLGISTAFPGSLLCQDANEDLSAVSLEELLETTISAAARYEQKSREAPASVTIITSEEIKRYGYRTLDEILNAVRGIFTRNDRNYANLGIRGFDRPSDYDNKILLMVNEHIVNENVYGAAFFGTDLGIEPDFIERIEIVRGPGSALYGTGAMFAVINIVIKEYSGIEGLKIKAETGSYGRKHGSFVVGREISEDMGFTASGIMGDIEGQDLYFEEFDDPATNFGKAQDLDWVKHCSFFAAATYKDFNFQGFITSRRKGIPTAAWEMEFNDDRAESLDERSYLALDYGKALGIDKKLTLKAYFDHYRYEGIYPYDILWFDSNTGDWIGGEAQFLWDLRADNRFIIGTEYRENFTADYRSWDEDTVYFDQNFPFSVFSFYAQDCYQITSRLSLTAGIRHDNYSTVGSSTTPRGAVVYNLNHWSSMKLLYSQAFRAPNVYEVHYEDPEIAKGNPELKPEKIEAAEVVWEQRLSKALYATASLYKYTMKDLIDQVEDPADELLQFRNITEVVAWGFELETNARLKNGLWGYLNYSYQNTENTETEADLSNTPSHLFKGGISYRVRNRLNAASEWYYETERKTLSGAKTDPFLLMNLYVSFNPFPRKIKLKSIKSLEIGLYVRNLLDVEYSLPASLDHEQVVIPQDGRNYTLRFSLGF